MRKTDCISYSLAKPWFAVLAPALLLAPTTLARVLKAIKAAVAVAAATALVVVLAALARVLEAALAATALVVVAAAVPLAAQALWHGLAICPRKEVGTNSEAEGGQQSQRRIATPRIVCYPRSRKQTRPTT